MERALDPASAETFNFSKGQQPLVDSAFLVRAMLRAPAGLYAGLSTKAKEHLRNGLVTTRKITPYNNNWLLFAALREADILKLFGTCEAGPVALALTQHEAWYRGDGTYSDGSDVHQDYYNSFVIHPVLVDIVDILEPAKALPAGLSEGFATRVRARAACYVVIQERQISKDGTWPPVGRSLAYRCGAFYALAQAGLKERLPTSIPRAQARKALGLAINASLSAAGTYTKEGFLALGLAGHQPALAERYISTASLYLASTAFLPLGLPAEHPFWASPALPITQQRI